MNCSTCRHSQPTIIEEDGDLVLVCQRYPPLLIWDVGDEQAVQYAGPQVSENAVCGEWQRMEPAKRGVAVLVRRHTTKKKRK